MKKPNNTSIIISICCILCTAGVVGSGIFQMVLLSIAGILGAVLAHDALYAGSNDTK